MGLISWYRKRQVRNQFKQFTDAQRKAEEDEFIEAMTGLCNFFYVNWSNGERELNCALGRGNFNTWKCDGENCIFIRMLGRMVR